MKAASEFIGGDWQLFSKDEVIKLINEGRKQAIEECAKVAKSIPVEYSEEARQRNVCPVKVVAAVDKQSILNLIKELK